MIKGEREQDGANASSFNVSERDVKILAMRYGDKISEMTIKRGIMEKTRGVKKLMLVDKFSCVEIFANVCKFA